MEYDVMYKVIRCSGKAVGTSISIDIQNYTDLLAGSKQ